MNKSTILDKIKKSNIPLEVILEIDRPNNFKVADEIDKVGNVIHVFKHIPYIAAEMEPDRAGQIANKVYNKDSDKIFHRTLTNGLEAIRGIDIASQYKAIPLPQTKNSYQKSEDLWNLRNLGIYEALEIATGKGVSVGIIDTGIDYTHKELSARFGSTKGIDLVSGDDPFDQNGHGTHVAGITAGANVGIARDCTLYAIRVLDENGSGSEISIMQGIEWSLENGMDVVNMSLGARDYTRGFEEMCNYAYNEGLVIVAAAGNDGGEVASYPAAFGECVVAVAALDRDNAHAPFSNGYKTNDISAPGVNVYSSYPGGRYRELSGTSMASPGIAGIMALGFQLTGASDPLELALKQSAEDLGNEKLYGAGIAQADKFLRRLQGMQSFRKPNILMRMLSI